MPTDSRRVLGLVLLGGVVGWVAACVPRPVSTPGPAAPQPAATPVPAPTLAPARFAISGELTQGGFVRGQAPTGTPTLTLGGAAVPLAADGAFFAAFDRDAPPTTELVAVLADGRRVAEPLRISPRAWRIEAVDAPLRPPGSSADFQRRRAGELARINTARSVQNDAQGWRQKFIWPARGRISGLFGSQRIYRGVPGSYHSGIDVAGGAGTPFVAPADGVVVLAAGSAADEFSLEGRLLLIDHGHGLNSAFLHSATLAVRTGEQVRQGQLLGTIGATGRATGPHLHWGLKWGEARLDPLLFTGPMP